MRGTLKFTHDRQVNQYLDGMKSEQRFSIGDKVHYLIKKDLDDKGSRPNWSATTHLHKHSYTLDNGVRDSTTFLLQLKKSPEECPARVPREQLDKQNVAH